MLEGIKEKDLLDAERILLSLRNSSKRKESIGDLIEKNTIYDLFEFIYSKPDAILMNISLSIIANLLTSEKGKERITEKDLKALTRTLEEISAKELYVDIDSSTRTCISSRAIRALGNATSGNEKNRQIIHKLSNNFFKIIASCLYLSEDEELFQVACRTIRIVASDLDQRRLASRYCGEMITKALRMDRVTAKAAVRTISTLSKASTIDLASALTHFDGKPLKIIIRAISSRDLQIKKDALSALLRLTQQQGACRPYIGNYGGLQVFIANMKKAGGGQSKDGLPFLKCIACCTREAINRTKLKDLDIFQLWKDVLQRERSDESDPENLLLDAKNVILTSLTNFYYDDDGLSTMVNLNYCLYLLIYLKDTLLCDEDQRALIFRPAAFSNDFPTFYNTTTPLPSEAPAETSLQVMKRITESSSSRDSGADSPLRSGSPDSLGAWSPPSSPPQRVFKRRRHESRSPVRFSDSELSATDANVDMSCSPINQITAQSCFAPAGKVNPRTSTSEQSSLVMIQRFMICQSMEIQRSAMKQICSAASINGLFKYFRAGANLTWVFTQIVNRIIDYSDHFTELISCSFPALITLSIQVRKRIIPEALDDNELEVAPVIAKWLSLFTHHSNENSIYFELYLSSDSDNQRICAARCIPFLLNHLTRSDTFYDLLPKSVSILLEHNDELTISSWTPIGKLISDIASKTFDKVDKECRFNNSNDEEYIKINTLMVSKNALCVQSPVFSAMLGGAFRESNNEVSIDVTHQEALQFFVHFMHKCDNCFDVKDIKIILAIDDLFQKYLLPATSRAKVQHRLWPTVKAEFLKSPSEILEKVTNDLVVDPGLNGLLFWPLEISKTLFEKEHDILLKEMLKQFPQQMKILMLSLFSSIKI